MEIPIELFSMAMGLSIVMVAISLYKNIPMVILISGIIMFSVFAITDTISRGSIPQSLTDSGSTVTVTWIEDPIDFTGEIKIMFILIASLVMLVGAIMQFNKGLDVSKKDGEKE